MIARIWHGWTTPQNADAYETLLKSEIFPGILAKDLPGFERIELYRRALADEVEFTTIMWFDTADAIARFAGPDPEAAYVPATARAILARFDERAQHTEQRAQCVAARFQPARRER